jgi:hypothetical protein
LMNRHARRQSAAVSNPALRSEHGGREQRPDAEPGAKQKVSRRGLSKHLPQQLCRSRDGACRPRSVAYFL